MDLTITKNFEGMTEAWLDGKRRVFMEGGTWSSKTYSALQFLHLTLSHTKEPLLASVVSESVPHLKRGAIRDFINILGDEFIDQRWNKSDSFYEYPETKSRLEFFSADVPSKLRGGRRQILFVNEANNIPYDGYRELDVRTELFTICDWNPVSEFWFHQNLLTGNTENVYLHSNYENAIDVIPAQVVADIESYKDKDPNWWRVYGLGLVGKIEGLVYPFFEQVDELPEGDRIYGLDFGFTDDPAVLTANVTIGDKLYSQELIYEKGLTNDAIARRMDLAGVKHGYDEIFADAAEPKSIEEIYKKGFNIKPCEKGPGSVEYGHQKVNQYQQYWTKDSINCIKEQRNFRYIPDKDGNLTEKTTHLFSHGMDSRRYAVAIFSTSGGKPKTKRPSFSFG